MTTQDSTLPSSRPETAIRVGLMGYGRAGREVAGQLLSDPVVQLQWIVKRSAGESTHPGSNVPVLGGDQLDIARLIGEKPVDFVVDFSLPDACLGYAKTLAKKGIGIISAVSAYQARHLNVLKQAGQTTVVMHSPNITLGINFIMIAGKILRKLAPHAGVEIVEEHFKDKTEVSGTAIRLAQALGLEPAKKINSIRVGGIVGRHEVIFGFPFQTIRLIHDSISRAAFGQGALFALKQLQGKSPGFYTMEQLVSEAFSVALKEAI